MWDCPFCWLSAPHWVSVPSSHLCDSAPPTHLNECGLFKSFVVVLPYLLISWWFWVLSWDLVVILSVVAQGGKACLPTPTSWPENSTSYHFYWLKCTIMVLSSHKWGWAVGEGTQQLLCFTFPVTCVLAADCTHNSDPLWIHLLSWSSAHKARSSQLHYFPFSSSEHHSHWTLLTFLYFFLYMCVKEILNDTFTGKLKDVFFLCLKLSQLTAHTSEFLNSKFKG